MALVAAVPGFIDYFFTVPPNSSAKRRATLHATVNLTAVVLFAIAWFMRGNAATQPDITILVVEGAASGLLLFGGYLGGILVGRNQIGVDHRYAEAGKWSEETVDKGRRWREWVVAKATDLKVDQMEAAARERKADRAGALRGRLQRL